MDQNEYMASLTSEDLLNSLAMDEPDPENRAAALRSLRGVPIEVIGTAPLDEQDFITLATSSAYRPANPLQRLRASHHELARLLASGHTRDECSLFTHYTVERINVLMLDPTFTALVESYRRQGSESVADIQGQLLSVALDSLQTFRERLEDKPGEISEKDLLSAAKLGLDRAGFGPTNKNLNLNVSAEVTEDKLAELHAKAANNSRATVKLVTSRTAPSSPKALPDASTHLPQADPDGRGLLADGSAEARPEVDDPGAAAGTEVPGPSD